MEQYEVVAAIIIKDGKVLCAQRSEHDHQLPLKWEFPGGKIEEGESPKEALKRELKEELNISVLDSFYYKTTQYEYELFQVKLHFYICEVSLDELEVFEHHQIDWVVLEKITSLDWAEADLEVVQSIAKI